MTRIAIKICGLSTPETLDAAIASGASHVGFVHFPKSPRHVDADKLAMLAAHVPAHVRKVGVLVDPDDALLDIVIRAGQLDAVQLHGKEMPDRIAAIRARHSTEIWKAVAVKSSTDIAGAIAYAGATDFLLFDAKTPEGANLPGGMGLRFDWRLLQGYNGPLPWGLSGGLDADNVADAILTTGTTLVDISSGVECAPGIKDVDKIAAFCQAVRQI